MNQVDRGTFEVEPGELVTIVWAIGQSAEARIDMALDGRPLLPELEDPPTFSFRVSRFIGDRHVLLIRGRFPASASDDVAFESVLTGSRRGQFDGPTLRRAPATRDMTAAVAFHVVTSAPGFGGAMRSG